MIASFSGEYRFLSNFYVAEVWYEGVRYRSSEHAFQAAKTLCTAERAKVAAAKGPGEAKRLGRCLSLRHDWEDIKVDVMRAVVRDKFMRHADLREKLLATGSQVLVEGNSWGDKVWGVCKGKGTNWLGRVLMEVRGELQGGV